MIAALVCRIRGRAAKLSASAFARNVATVGGSVAAAQAISVAFTPLLTRLYDPEAFGILAAYTAILSIMAPMATLGYANAIVIPETEDGARATIRVSILCGLIVAPLALLLIHILKPSFAEWTGLEVRPNFLYLIPLSLLFSAFLSVANQLAIREGLFKTKAHAFVVSTLVTNIAKLAGGLATPSGLLLICVGVMRIGFNGLLLLSRAPRTGLFCLREWFSLVDVLKAASDHRDFALFRMPQSVLLAASLSLPVILLSALFGADTAGQYSITVLILSAPVALIGDSVGEVFYPKITRIIQQQPQDATSLILKTTAILASVSLLPFGTLALFGDWIFPIVFGQEWARAGEFAQWVALWMAAVLVTRPVIAAMPALQMQGTLLVYEAIITGVRALALYIGFQVNSDRVAVAAFALANLIGYTALFCLVAAKAWRVANRQFKF